MANPYYIPRQRRNDSLLSFAELATRLYGIKQQSRLSEAETAARNRSSDIEEKKYFGTPGTGTVTQPDVDVGKGPFQLDSSLNLPARTGTPAVAGLMSMKQRELGISQQQADTEQRRVEAGIPYHDRQFDANDHVNYVIGFEKLGLGKSKFLEMTKQAAGDKTITKGAMFANLKTNPAYRDVLKEDVQNAIIKGSSDPAFVGSDQEKKLRGLLTIADNDQAWGALVDKMSPSTAQSLNEQTENSKAALLNARLEGSQASLEARIGAQRDIAEARNATTLEVANARARSSEEIAGARLEAAKAIAGQKATAETPATKRAAQKEIADAEAIVMQNKGSEAAGSHADFFNQYATKPYAYTFKESRWGGGEFTKIKLPKIKGRQVTAKDVYDTAEKHGLTYDEVLQKIGAVK